MTQQRFTTTVTDAARGRVRIPIPFHPDTVWGAKPGHDIHGTVNGMSMRGVVEAVGDGFGFTLGPAWLRCCHLAAGNTATVDIEPEGPQRDDLADDVAAALRANPHAAAFFDSLAQFYRRAYLRWIDATKYRLISTQYETTASKGDPRPTGGARFEKGGGPLPGR